MNLIWKEHIKNIAVIIVGSLLFALGINAFIIPAEFGEGGVIGTTIILYYLYGWSPGIANLIINSILIIIGYKFLSKKTVIYTCIAVACYSFFLQYTQGFALHSDELIINMVFGGLFVGVGIGLIMRVGGTTAGSTILAKLTNKYLGLNVSYSLLFFDLIVVFASYFIIGIEKVLLTIMMLYIATKAMERVIEGFSPKKAIMVISEKSSEIAQEVTKVMDRGVTVLDGHGYYTKQQKEVLYIVISSQEVVKFKSIVHKIDKNAFLTIHDVRDVFGEGFIDLAKAHD